jgi:two-component system sensor histidine kinase TctE
MKSSSAMLPQFVILPLAVLLIWLALARGIQPLNELEQRIRQRKPDDMSPLDEAWCLSRCHHGVLHQRFAATPARLHRYPKTVSGGCSAPVENPVGRSAYCKPIWPCAKTPMPMIRKQSLHHIGRASIRATHTVNQLLALARAESSGAPVAKQACDLSALTMEVVKDCLPRAMDKHIDLGFDNACESAGLQGNPTLLKEMVRNLIENALNYTPSTPDHPGVVTARVYRNAKHALVLQVEDSGPGIAEAERERVFEPFYRVLGTEADGFWLGFTHRA